MTSALADEPSLLFAGAGYLALGAYRNGPGWSLDGAPPLIDDVVALSFTPTLASLEEVRVVAGSSSVTWPRGAAVALVTRSGTNVLRASAYDFHRDDALDANTFFRNRSPDAGERDHPPEVRADIFGYTAGGPIRRDRSFVFWSQEWRRTRGDTPEDRIDGRQETVRLDHQASARWRLMGRYTHDAIEEGQSPRRAAHLGMARATAAISATAVNELSYAMTSGGGGTIHGLGDRLALQRGGHALVGGGSAARAPGHSRFEAFVQDSWRAHRALTVDLGLRRAPGSWEPGAGVAWRPREQSPTVLRAGFAAAENATRMRQWSLGVARRLYARGTIDAAYLGRRADEGPRERALRYEGLLAHFRHDGTAGLLDVAYTIGRDEVDRGFAWDRSVRDRRHVFTATWVRDLGGWTIAGITTFQSGPPAGPVTVAGRGGIAARQVSDPFVNLPSDQYYFNPAAFAPPEIGAPGSLLSPFSLPGRNQWDVAVSRVWRVHAGARVRLRAELFNVFNHTQFTTADTVCTAAADETTCAVANTTLGQYTAARAPRQVQLSVRLDWN